jgi:cytochrome c oxidase assembly protein subunit 15
LAIATFPLLWVGSLVTTYHAGMSVEDWPSTFGHWFYAPQWFQYWDVFLEHSHRVIGMVVGMLTIALLAALWWLDGRRLMRWLGIVALLGVIFQGVLGGMRVLLNEIVLANIHGCVAPLFFALTAALVTLTSAPWRATAPAPRDRAQQRLSRVALAVTLLFYLQIVLGAQMRHLPPWAGPHWLELWLWLHLLNAGLLVAAVVLLLVMAFGRDDGSIVARRARLLGGLFLTQLLLGALAWIARYGWPVWATRTLGAVNFTVVDGGWLQSLAITLHVGVGALCLVTALSLAFWSRRTACAVTR